MDGWMDGCMKGMNDWFIDGWMDWSQNCFAVLCGDFTLEYYQSKLTCYIVQYLAARYEWMGHEAYLRRQTPKKTSFVNYDTTNLFTFIPCVLNAHDLCL